MFKKFTRVAVGWLIVTMLAASPAWAADWISKGSLAEGGHTHYIPNVSNPFQNETPFITTEARILFLHNDVPNTVFHAPIATRGGGHLNVIALQLRVALSERLGIIMNKAAYMDFNHANSGRPRTTDYPTWRLGPNTRSFPILGRKDS